MTNPSQTSLIDASEIMCKVSCSNCVTYDVNNCVHPLVVLVLCVFGTCRAFLVPTEGFFSHAVLMLIFRVHPCLFASRALELMSAQFLPLIVMLYASCSETVS